MIIEANKILELNGNQAAVYGLCQGSEPVTFFSCGSDKVIREWNLAEGKVGSFALGFPLSLYSAAYDPVNKWLFAGDSNGNLFVVAYETKTILKVIHLAKAPVFALCFSAKHQLLVVASSEGSIYFITLSNLEISSQHKLCAEKVRALDCNQDESELAVACGDGTIRIFDMHTQTEKLKFAAHQFSANAVLFHPDGKHLLSGGKDAHLKVWKKNSPLEYELLHSIPAHNFAIYSLAFHPNKKLFASGSRDKTIKIWDAESFQFLLRISKENQNGHMNSVNKIYWSTYKNTLLSTGDDRSIKAWDITTS